MSADSSGRETRLLSGFSLGGDSSRYCMTADKYAWTHPGRVINSSVIGVFITQTEIDTQGSDFSGFLLQKKGEKVPFLKRLESWRIFEKLFDCFIVLFMKAGGALPCPHTKKLPLVQVSLSTVVRARLYFSVKCIMKGLRIFFFLGKHCVSSLLNIVIMVSLLFCI